MIFLCSVSCQSLSLSNLTFLSGAIYEKQILEEIELTRYVGLMFLLKARSDGVYYPFLPLYLKLTKNTTKPATLTVN